MAHEITPDGAGRSRVRLLGDIDFDTSPAMRKAILNELGRRRAVTIDLSAVGYIDSSVVASLVEAYQKARQAGLGFVLTGVGERVRRVLELSRLDQVLPIDD